MKQTLNLIIVLLAFSITFVACSKKSKDVVPVTPGSNFYYGNILGSPNTIIGPGNAILLRANGTMREYANDYFSLGTTMTAKDTTNAKIKLDGTYTTSKNESGTIIITANWYQPNGSPALTYTLVGAISGNTMSGTLTDVGTGIGTVAQFKFTNITQSQ